MIERTDPNDGVRCRDYEAAVVELLVRLYEPSFHDDWSAAWSDDAVDLDTVTSDDLPLHERHQVVDLIRRRGHELTDDERDLLRRASDVEFEHAAFIEQARSFGLHLQLWPEGKTAASEYRVRWRMADWSRRSGTHVRVHSDHESAARHVAELKSTSRLAYVTVDERPVGTWRALDQFVEWLNAEQPAPTQAR